MAKYNALTEDFEEVTVLEKPALFTPARIDRSTVPHGYHLYEVRHDDDCRGDAVQIARNIYVNHWGSLITRDEIELGADGFLDIAPEDLNYSAGDCRNISDFMAKYKVVLNMDEQENTQFIWTPIKLTDKATDRSVHITIVERELYLSGFFTFEDFWNGENPPETLEEPELKLRREQ